MLNVSMSKACNWPPASTLYIYIYIREDVFIIIVGQHLVENHSSNGLEGELICSSFVLNIKSCVELAR